MRINQPHIQTAMDRFENLLVVPAASAYPRPLRLESAASRTSHMLLDDTEHVRLAIASSEQASVAFIDQRPVCADTYLKIAIPAGTDEHVDLLVPLVPAERDIVVAELAFGKGCGLREADCHGRGHFHRIAMWIRRSHWSMKRAQAVRFCEVIAERHPETGQTHCSRDLALRGTLGHAELHEHHHDSRRSRASRGCREVLGDLPAGTGHNRSTRQGLSPTCWLPGHTAAIDLH